MIEYADIRVGKLMDKNDVVLEKKLESAAVMPVRASMVGILIKKKKKNGSFAHCRWTTRFTHEDRKAMGLHLEPSLGPRVNMTRM